MKIRKAYLREQFLTGFQKGEAHMRKTITTSTAIKKPVFVYTASGVVIAVPLKSFKIWADIDSKIKG